jgi:hypothetical protein
MLFLLLKKKSLLPAAQIMHRIPGQPVAVLSSWCLTQR